MRDLSFLNLKNKLQIYKIFDIIYHRSADVAQEVAHILGKDEVTGSSPVISSIFIIKILNPLYSENPFI